MNLSKRPSDDDQDSLSFDADQADPEAMKSAYRKFYDTVTTQLNSEDFGEFSYFLNYGYTPDSSPQHSVVSLPKRYLNRNSVKLVLELVGDCPIDGRRVLDVGCGRGGTVREIAHFFEPASVIGLDLSPEAVAFCRQTHSDPRLQFEVGDAEQLPFANTSFDVVTNIESSHSYPNVQHFFDEVFRVLVPGGHFLYTDIQLVESWRECVEYLQSIGYVVERDTDITANVLLSCDEIAKTRIQAFSKDNNPELLNNLLAVPGSEVYDSMQQRTRTYNILKLHKPGPPA